jgi:hypothetical protein
VNADTLKLAGNVIKVSLAALYPDDQERITVWVEGAEQLYAELRVPNQPGWAVGQRVVLVIMPTASVGN